MSSRSLLGACLALVIGCREPPPESSTGSASTAPSTTKIPMCGGHWIGSLSAPCADLGELAQFDFVLRAKGSGWDLAFANPPGVVVKSIDVTWSEIAAGCYAEILIEKDKHPIRLELNNGAGPGPIVKTMKYSLGIRPHHPPVVRVGTDHLACEIETQFTFTPDDGAVPSPDPALARFAGDYTLHLAWEENGCRFDELPILRFHLRVDPRENNSLRTDQKFDLLAMLFQPGLTQSEVIEMTKQGIRITQSHEAFGPGAHLKRTAKLDIAPHEARLQVVHSRTSNRGEKSECSSLATIRGLESPSATIVP